MVYLDVMILKMVCFSIAEAIIVPTDIFTQAGCNVTAECSANNPHTIGWSTRRTSFAFVNTTTRSSLVSVTGEMLVVCVCVCVCMCVCVCVCVYVCTYRTVSAVLSTHRESFLHHRKVYTCQSPKLLITTI